MSLILSIAVALMCSHDCLAQALDAKPAAPPFSVSIAVPMDANGDRSIPLHWSDPHIDVVITNTSSQLHKVWAEDCALGYDNLTLEIVAVDGKTLPKPIVVSRPGGVAWSGSFSHGVIVAPGNTMVREVRLPKYGANAKQTADTNIFDYQNFPNARTVRMRAVFQIGDGDFARGRGIWTGRVTSDTGNYQIANVSP